MKKKNINFSGMSLIEMIVAIAIFSLGISGFSLLFIKSWKTNAYIYEAGQDSFIASRAVNSLVNNLRRIKQAENGDYPIKSASDFDLVAYMDIDDDNKAEKIHYYLNQDSDELRLGVSQPSASNPPVYASGDDVVSVLAMHVVNSADQPIFSYFSNNYLSDNTPFEVPVGSENINNIKIIKANILVDIRPYNSPDHITIESFAQLRNLKDYEE